MVYIIVGASKNLGMAFVRECFERGASRVIALARTSAEKVVSGSDLDTKKGFEYISLDISVEECIPGLESIRNTLGEDRLCVIFNAAIIQRDIDDHGNFDHQMYNQVSDTGIKGFGNIVSVFGEKIKETSGIFVTISSTASLTPVLGDRWISYPAHKAYLNVAMRSLRVIWPCNTSLMSVVLGHVGSGKYPGAPNFLVPSYKSAAEAIISRIHRKKVPFCVYFPLWYRILGFMALFLPDRFFCVLFNRCALPLLCKKRDKS